MMIEPYKLARGLGWFSLALGAAELFAASPIGRMLGTRRTGWICAFGSREVAAGLVILARSRPGAGPIWFRVGGDVLDLACLVVLMASGGRQTGTVAATAAVAGATAADLYCALTLGKGACDPLAMRSSITVGGSPEELYAQWRDPQRLAAIMAHFAEVTGNGNLTHWRVPLPTGCVLEWDSEVVESRQGEMVRWRSVEGGDISTEGSVHFAPAPGGKGTEVTLAQSFTITGNPAKTVLARGFKMIPKALTSQALRWFKSLAETGECPTLSHNPAARSGATANLF